MELSAADYNEPVLPNLATLDNARNCIFKTLPEVGIGSEILKKHLSLELLPGFSQNSKSSRYYGFVTGGATPAARMADELVTECDQNVQVHLPNETISTDVEHHALNMLCELLDFSPNDWSHKTFTTGATASNIIGLACAREHIIAEAGRLIGREASVAEHGIVEAMQLAGLEEVQILTTVPHSSIRKAASILGLGRSSVKDVGSALSTHHFSYAKLRDDLMKPKTASIIMISSSEVNTGLFATNGLAEMKHIRALADQFGAWIHVDAAFGLMARVLDDTSEFSTILGGVQGLELADSITGDAHKLLNVPYDCGFLLSRHLSTGIEVFQNPNAAYLSVAVSDIPSPLNVGIENSRRFRALPVYANLVAYGKAGFLEMLVRQIRLARRIATYLLQSRTYELLPKMRSDEESLGNVFIIVLFRARDEALNADLVRRINGTRKIYCSGTSWKGKPAVRFAVSNWQAEVSRDWPVIEQVLEEVARNGPNANGTSTEI